MFSAVAALALYPALSPVIAAGSDTQPETTASIGDGVVKSRFLALGVGKSMVVDLPRDAKDVLVADPKIANAVVRSSRRAYVIGAAVGQTNVVFFDADGQTVASYDIAVKRDLNGVRAALKQTLPGINIEGVGDGVILTGSVSSPIEAQQAGDLAARLVGGAEKVVNSIVVRGRDQVMLKVTVAEVRRDIIKQLGVDLNASMNYGTAVGEFQQQQSVHREQRTARAWQCLTAAALNKAGLPSVTATLRAMESAGVVRTLAEPNLTAISGKSATFISGGEFPIPTGYPAKRRQQALSDNASKRSVQKIRHLAEFHAGRAERRADQPAGDDRSVGSLDRKFLERRCRWNDDSLDQDPSRRNHAGNPIRRLDRDGWPDPGTDQASHERNAGRRPVADSWRALPEPGLRQQRDRADGHRHALCRSGGCAEGAGASR